MAKNKIDRPQGGHSASGRFGARLVASLAFLLTAGLWAPAFAAGCPKSPEVFAANGRWASADVGAGASELRILAIGSSSTEGIGASRPTHTYPADLQSLLEARFPSRAIEVVNAGIGGETAGETVTRLEAALASGGYDLVIWQVGTNDAVRAFDRTSFQSILEEGIRAAHRARTPLILVDPQYFPASARKKDYASFVDIVDEVGKERGVPVFSRYSLMKAWRDESANLLDTMLSKDRFHMSDRGYACWADLLAGDIAERIPTLVATRKGGRAKSLRPVAARSRSPTPVP